jgi:hypothetical protein
MAVGESDLKDESRSKMHKGTIARFRGIFSFPGLGKDTLRSARYRRHSNLLVFSIESTVCTVCTGHLMHTRLLTSLLTSSRLLVDIRREQTALLNLSDNLPNSILDRNLIGPNMYIRLLRSLIRRRDPRKLYN